MRQVNHRERKNAPSTAPFIKGKPRPDLVVKLVLALLTIGLCAYTLAALAGVNGLNIFTVHSTLGSIYAKTYRYAVIGSVLSLLAWIFWAVVLRGRKKREKKAEKISGKS